MIRSSYEALRLLRLDLFTVMLRQIGAYIAKSQLNDAVNTIVSGDGNDNPAENISVKTSGIVTYGDLVSFWNGFAPYKLNTIIASPDITARIFAMNEIRGACLYLSSNPIATVDTLMGAKFFANSAVAQGTLIGLDKSCALKMIQEGEITTEYNKLIDRQFESAAITDISGFVKICADASKVLEI